MNQSLRTSLLTVLIALIPMSICPCAHAEEFNPLAAPTKSEWQHFHKMSGAQIQKLWLFQVQKGHKKLGDWSWQWRMGWLQRCEPQMSPNICGDILKQGLIDDAMVVRAEAATRIGNRFEGQPSNQFIESLKNSYIDSRNTRNGSPLFVCDRILEALHKMGGNKAIKLAGKLAMKHPDTQAYWAKINKR